MSDEEDDDDDEQNYVVEEDEEESQSDDDADEEGEFNRNVDEDEDKCWDFVVAERDRIPPPREPLPPSSADDDIDEEGEKEGEEDGEKEEEMESVVVVLGHSESLLHSTELPRLAERQLATRQLDIHITVVPEEVEESEDQLRPSRQRVSQDFPYQKKFRQSQVG